MALNIVTQIDDPVRVRRVLISVSNKQKLPLLIQGLLATVPDVQILSTGGNYAAILDHMGATTAQRHLIAVSDYTGQPEMQGGLVKTLDFRIYLGLLSETYNPAHQTDLERLGATPLDMVVVNLYPFQETVARPEVTPESARTHIDIGGPCMIRAAAKNYLRVASVTDPADYERVVTELQNGDGTLGLALRLDLMRKAFCHTAAYDQAIAAYFQAVDDSAARACYHDAGAPAGD